MGGQGTTEIRSKFNIEKLNKYLALYLPNYSGGLSVRQFSHGQSNPTYLLSTNSGQKYVMRKKPSGKLSSKRAHAVEREYQVMKALELTDVPVPKVYVLCEDASVIGTPFYIMEFCEGRIFTNSNMPGCTPSERAACYQAACKTLVNLHQVNIKDASLGNFGRMGEYYNRQIRGLSKTSKYQAKIAGPIPKLEEITTFLTTHQPKDMISIIHGDYKLDNLVFHPTEPRVIAILDWEMSTLGHPMADLGNFASMVYTFPNFQKLKKLGIPNPEEFAQMYYNLSNIDYPDVWWPYHPLFSHFKNAVIIQGILMRQKQGVASSAKAAQIGKMFLPWCKLLEQKVNRFRQHLVKNNILITKNKL